MPIPIICDCGKQLRAPDEFAGKRVKCPACGEPVAVPARAAAPQKVAAGSRPVARPTPPPAPAPAADVVRFNCACGKGMQAKTEHAGKLARCPACGETTMIPAPSGGSEARIRASKPNSALKRVVPPPPDEDDEEARPRKRRPVPAASDEDDDRDERSDEDDDHPRKKKKGKKPIKKGGGGKLWLWLSLAACLLLLMGGGGVLGWWLLAGGADVEDFALVPANAQLVVTARMSEAAKNPNMKKLYDQLESISKAQAGNRPKDIDLNIHEIDRMTIVFTDVSAQTGWALSTMLNPIDREKTLKEFGDNLTKISHEGKTYHKRSDGSCVYFLSDKRILIGKNEAGMKQCLSLMTSGKKEIGPMSTAISQGSAKSHHLFIAVIPPAEAMQQAKAGINGNPAMKQFESLVDVQSLMLTADVTEAALTWELSATYSEPTKADKAKKAAELGLTQLKGLMALASLGGGQQPKEAQEAMAKIGKLLEEMKPELKGSAVSIQGKLDPSIFANIGSMMPPGAGFGPGPAAGGPRPGAPGPGAGPMRPPVQGKGGLPGPRPPGGGRLPGGG